MPAIMGRPNLMRSCRHARSLRFSAVNTRVGASATPPCGEVTLFGKLAGHANAVVTLGHYTQAVRGGEDAVAALEGAYAGG
jgi:hypothetical protein